MSRSGEGKGSACVSVGTSITPSNFFCGNFFMASPRLGKEIAPTKAGRNKGTPWTNALRKAVAQYDVGSTGHSNALRAIADNVVECALNPESPHFEFAIKELGGRLDGTPKPGDGVDAAVFLHSISDAFAALSQFKSEREVIDGEVVVSDRSVLSSAVCVEAGGYGAGVGISDVSEGSGES